MKIYAKLLAPLVATVLLAGPAHASLIGTITHDYGSAGHVPGGLQSGGSCDTLNSSSVTIRNTSGCQRFFDSFDLSGLAYDNIDSFSLSVTFSDTANSIMFGLIPTEWWRVRPASSAVDGSNITGSSLGIDRSANLATNTFTFDDTLDVFGDILDGEAFYLWFSHVGLGTQSFNLYSASLEVYGTAQAAVPEPAMLSLMGLGLLGLAYSCRRRAG